MREMIHTFMRDLNTPHGYDASDYHSTRGISILPRPNICYKDKTLAAFDGSVVPFRPYNGRGYDWERREATGNEGKPTR